MKPFDGVYPEFIEACPERSVSGVEEDSEQALAKPTRGTRVRDSFLVFERGKGDQHAARATHTISAVARMQHQNSRRKCPMNNIKKIVLGTLMATVTFFGGATVSAWAATLHVANNGVDSPTCGGKTAPCRSISQAIANASDEDRIVVGPGRYGDLNGDGDFHDPGEEAAELDFGCFCMIKVNKPVTIESSNGALATVLDDAVPDTNGFVTSVVSITASSVVFGRPKRGFTLTGGRGPLPNGLFITNTNGVKVEGNVARTGRGTGFFVPGGNAHVFRDNLAISNFVGFAFFGGGDHLLKGNVAVANSTGFYLQESSGNVLKWNVANSNRDEGFRFFLSGGGNVLEDNAALGNQGFGIRLDVGGVATVRRNNIYGNNDTLEPFTGLTNCGLCNESGNTIDATHNFWGTSRGPGPDPADAVCNAGIGSNTTVEPVAEKEFKIRMKVGQ
jgi:parallel beta-helix repeat protein